MARLGDVCTVVSGTTPKSDHPEYWDGEINWVTPAELTDDSNMIFESQRKITQQAVKDSSLKAFPAGTVLLSSRAPIGKVAIAGTEMYCNQGFKNLICSERIYNRYLYHFLRSKTAYLNSLGRGATFKEISKSIVENIEIPLPPLDEQRKIAAVVDKVSDLIAKRRQQLDKLDTLVKARFVEMFGDLQINNKNWGVALVGENCFVTKLAGFEYTNYIHYQDAGDVVMVKAQNVKDGKLNNKELSYISSDVSNLLPRSQLAAGDIVMTYVGANIGDVALIDDKHRYHLAPNVAKISPDKEKYDSVFFMHMLMMLRTYISGNSADTAKAALSMERIRNLSVFIPPMNLQRIFASFAEQVEKLKSIVIQNFEQLEMIKKSLLQQYFG